ncbi:MAG: sugar phosphate nucleotidyltransferase, partial [ANME-2 cluster archaeon]|nr:sugar phosphate nucleotidyltransferase [ANME-2 cluster archaeon]
VILAAGEGQRCKPLTLTRSKVMLFAANKPILEHVINALAYCGIIEIIMVVGYKKERIMDYFQDGVELGVNITYVEQKGQLGTAHAIKKVAPYIDDEFIVLNGDNIVESGTISDILEGHTGDATVLTVTRVNTSGYGVVVSDKNRVLKIVEKPVENLSHNVNTGIYIFKPDVFEYIKATHVSETGEYAITDTIQIMIDAGKTISVVHSKSTWIDAVHSWDLLRANASLLERCEKSIRYGTIEDGAVIKGNVIIGENTIVRSGSYIIGPVVIGKNCDIGPNTVILPSTTIGNNSTVQSSVQIKNSIIMNDARIGAFSYISSSIIGSHNSIGSHFITQTGENLLIEINGILHKAEKLGTVIGDGNNIQHRVLTEPGKMIATGCRVSSGAIIVKDLPRDSIII